MEPRHHIRPVGVIGNAAKTFGLALRTEHRAGCIKTRECRIFGRFVGTDDLERRLVAEARNSEAFFVELVILRPQFVSIEQDADQLLIFAVQKQRRFLLSLAAGLRRKSKARCDTRMIALNIDIESDPVDQEIGRGVIL